MFDLLAWERMQHAQAEAGSYPCIVGVTSVHLLVCLFCAGPEHILILCRWQEQCGNRLRSHSAHPDNPASHFSSQFLYRRTPICLVQLDVHMHVLCCCCQGAQLAAPATPLAFPNSTNQRESHPFNDVNAVGAFELESLVQL
jgi:hypothetical protein